MAKPTKIRWDHLAVIGAIALVARVWNVLTIGPDFYANFLSDASTYKLWASRLAAGASYGEPVFQMGPLYPYFLAFMARLSFGFYGVLFVQAVLGALAALLVYHIARRIFSQPAALLSGILTALYAPFIFYDGLLLSESLQIFLLACGLYFLLGKGGRYGWLKILAAGFFIGLVALGRATIFFFPLIVAVYWLVKYFRAAGKRDRAYLNNTAILFAGVIIGILPALMNNLAYGDFVPVSSNTGINFYVGNNARSTGAYDEPPGLDLATDFTGRKIAEKEMGHPLKSSEVSAFWTTKTLSDIKAAPGAFIARLAKKTWLYFWYLDISQVESLQIQKKFSPLFYLPLPGFGLIMIFGLIGILWTRADERRWILLWLFLANALGAILFFVIGRFRLWGALALLISSGAGIMVCWQFIRSRQWRQIMPLAAFVLIALVILFLPRSIDPRDKLASAYDNVGIFYHFKGEPAKSIEWYRKAAETAPRYSPSFNNIGTYFYGRGSLDSAEYYFRRSLSIDSTEPKTLMNLGKISMDRDELDQAYFYYQEAQKYSPFGVSAQSAVSELDRIKAGGQPSSPNVSGRSFDALLTTAERLSAMGNYAEAEKYYSQALSIKPDDIRALNNLGFAFQAQKKYYQAAQIFDKVLKIAPANAIAYNNLAGTVYQIGLLDSAETLWRKAIVLDPGNQQIKNNLDYLRKTRYRP